MLNDPKIVIISQKVAWLSKLKPSGRIDNDRFFELSILKKGPWMYRVNSEALIGAMVPEKHDYLDDGCYAILQANNHRIILAKLVDGIDAWPTLDDLIKAYENSNYKPYPYEMGDETEFYLNTNKAILEETKGEYILSNKYLKFLLSTKSQFDPDYRAINKQGGMVIYKNELQFALIMLRMKYKK